MKRLNTKENVYHDHICQLKARLQNAAKITQK